MKQMITILNLLVVLVGLPAFAAPDFDAPPGLVRAMEAQDGHTEVLMTKRGVVGTGVGYNAAGEPAIKVFVQTQSDLAGLPQTLDGIPVEVAVTGMFVARHHRNGHNGGPGGGGDPEPEPESAANCESVPSDSTARFERPVCIGVSTGHPAITAGTIGCRVTDGTDVYALSNNHVYANSNAASIGDAVIQPGTFDGGSSPADDIGKLEDYEPIDFSGGDNYMDAAIISTTTLFGNSILGNSTPADGYGTPSVTSVAASVGLGVQKFGRTTKLTTGTIDAINATVKVCYKTAGPFCTKLATFIGQIMVTDGSFSAGGDSGSLVVTNDDNNNPVGLLFAGSSTHTIANPIGLVLERFGVDVDGI
jgi:hypothetical protein